MNFMTMRINKFSFSFLLLLLTFVRPSLLLQVEDNHEHKGGRGDRDGKLCKSLQFCWSFVLILISEKPIYKRLKRETRYFLF